MIERIPDATQAYYAEQIGVSKRTISRIFSYLQGKGILIQTGTKRRPNWVIRKQTVFAFAWAMKTNNEEFAAFGVKNCQVVRYDF